MRYPESTECVTDETELINFEKFVKVQTKYISKYFNPKTYKEEDGKMNYRVS